MIRAKLFILFHTFVTIYAVLAGGRAERRAGFVFILAWVMTLAARRPFAERFMTIEWGILTADLFMLFAMIFVAVKSDRRWPIWVSAIQLFSVLAHIVQALHPGIWRGYQVILAADSWLNTAILAAAVATRPRLNEVGDPSWSRSFAAWVRRFREKAHTD